MNNKNYLNEENYRKNAKKLNVISNVLLIIGGIMALLGFIMSFGFSKTSFGIFAVLGMACVGFGAVTKMLGNGRNISAFLAQQQMPIAKEGIEKMAPSAGVAAKEIAKGIKEGLKDEEK